MDPGALHVAVPVTTGGRVVGAVLVTAPLDQVEARTRSAWFLLIGASMVVLAVVALGGWLLARTVTRPLRALERATADLAGGDLEARAPTAHGPPEVRRVASAFNRMATRLDRLVTEQRWFAADASHQLRTPLTALRLRTAAWSRRQDRVPIRNGPAPAATAQAVPGAVEEILDNLLDNAVRASPDGVAVRLWGTSVGDAVELHVTDWGPVGCRRSTGSGCADGPKRLTSPNPTYASIFARPSRD